MLKITLARRRLLPGLWKLPAIDLPRVRVDFPEEVLPPWREIKVERVLFAPIKGEWFIFRVIFDGRVDFVNNNIRKGGEKSVKFSKAGTQLECLL